MIYTERERERERDRKRERENLTVYLRKEIKDSKEVYFPTLCTIRTRQSSEIPKFGSNKFRK